MALFAWYVATYLTLCDIWPNRSRWDIFGTTVWLVSAVYWCHKALML